MENNLYRALFTEIQKAFPKKSIMVSNLSDILRIEKGAVYRRLRQNVPFTFNEIVLIAKHLNISLDRIVGIEDHKSILFQLRFINFLYPQTGDYYTLNLFINFIKSLNKEENSETTSISNVLPHDLFLGFNYLLKFYLFVWNYHHNFAEPKPFHQISIAPEMKTLLDEYMLEMKNIGKTNFVFDNGLFRFFVDRVNYFHSIRLIEKEDVSKIKQDLHSMLDYLEKMGSQVNSKKREMQLIYIFRILILQPVIPILKQKIVISL